MRHDLSNGMLMINHGCEVPTEKKTQKKKDTALKKSFNLQELCSEGDL